MLSVESCPQIGSQFPALSKISGFSGFFPEPDDFSGFLCCSDIRWFKSFLLTLHMFGSDRWGERSWAQTSFWPSIIIIVLADYPWSPQVRFFWVFFRNRMTFPDFYGVSLYLSHCPRICSQFPALSKNSGFSGFFPEPDDFSGFFRCSDIRWFKGFLLTLHMLGSDRWGERSWALT